MPKKLIPYDPAEDLLSDSAMTFFISEAFKTNDPNYVAYAISVVARAKGITTKPNGMAYLAKLSGLTLSQLERFFSEKSNPSLKTTFAVLKALDIDIIATKHAA